MFILPPAPQSSCTINFPRVNFPIMEDALHRIQQWKLQKKKQKPIHHVKGNYDAKNDRTVLHII